MADYRPGLPEHNDNVSHESPVKEFLSLLLGVLLLLSLAYWALGLAIDKAVDYLPYEDEAKLFEKLPVEWGAVIGGDIQATNPRLQSLVDALRQCSELPVPISVSTLGSESPNAVALPGSQMLVFDGLFDYVQSENGLAFVLAHELGHFINRDHLKGIGRGIVLLSLSSVLTGPSSSLSRLLTPSIQLNTARFSQKRESEADQTALEILKCHYGHIDGAAEFFEALKISDLGDSSVNHYFASHPEFDTRIKHIDQWKRENAVPSGTTVPWEVTR